MGIINIAAKTIDFTIKKYFWRLSGQLTGFKRLFGCDIVEEYGMACVHKQVINEISYFCSNKVLIRILKHFQTVA